MKRLALLSLAALTVGTSCQRQPEGALLVTAKVDPSLVADCLRLSLLDTSDNELRYVTFPRVKSQGTYLVAVGRPAGVAAEVHLQGSAWLGTCNDETTLKWNSKSAVVAATFPTTNVTQVEVAINVPGASQDMDGDGFAGGAGGADCNDHDKTIFPGSVQLCNVYVDTNCNGLIACADPDCATSPDCANPPSALQLTGVSPSQTAQTCSPFTVELHNASGLRTAVAPVSVGLSSNLPATFYTTANCAGTAVTTATIDFGAQTVQVWVSFTGVGLATLTASATGLTSASAKVDVAPQPVNSIRISGLPGTVNSKACVGPAQVQLFDSMGHGTTSTGGLMVGLSVTPSDSGGNFFSDATCTTKVSAVAVAAGQGAGTFYFSGAAQGARQVKAALSASITATADVQVTAGPPQVLSLANAPLVLTTSTCSPLPLDVQLQDAAGNPATAPVDVALQVSSNLGMQFFTDNKCTLSASGGVTLKVGSQSVQVWALGTSLAARGQVTVATTGVVTFPPVSQSISVGSGAPSQIAFVNSSAQTIVAGDCSGTEIDVEVQDASGSPSVFTVSQQVTLSAGTGNSSVQFFQQSGCGGVAASTFTLAANVSRVRLFFRSTLAQTFTLGVSMTGIASAISLPNNLVKPGVPQQLAWSPATPTIVDAVAGKCSPAMTLTVQDQYANPTTFTSDAALSFTPATLAYGTAAGTCGATSGLIFPKSTPSISVQAGGTAAGTYLLNAAAAGVASTNTATLRIGPDVPLFTAPASAAATAGVCTTVTYSSRDQYSNPVNGTLKLAAAPTGYTYFADATCNTSYTAAGVAVTGGGVTLSFKSTKTQPPTATIAASLTVGANTYTANTSVTTSPGPAQVTFTPAGPVAANAGVCSSVVVNSFDTVGPNPVDGLVTVTNAPAKVTFFSDSGCSKSFGTPSSSGGLFTLYFLSTGAGTGTVTVQVGSVSGSFQLNTSPATGTVTVAGVPLTVTSNVCSATPLVITSQDTFMNPVDGVVSFSAPTDFHFYKDAACTQQIDGNTKTVSGTANIWVKALTAGTPTLHAVVGSNSSGNFSVTVNPGPATITPTPSTLNGIAGSCLALQLQSQDGQGNKVDGVMSFVGTPLSVRYYIDAACSMDLSGQRTSGGVGTVYVKTKTAGTTNLTAQVDSVSVTVTLTVTHGPASVKQDTPTLSLTASATSCLPLAGITFTSADTSGNPVDGVFSFASIPTGFDVYVDSACSTANKLNGQSTSGGTIKIYLRSTKSGTFSLTGRVDANSAPPISVTVSPDTASAAVTAPSPMGLTAGKCDGTTGLTFTSTDQYGNPVDGAFSITGPADFNFYPDATCTPPLGTPTTTNGIYTVYVKSTKAATGNSVVGTIGGKSATVTANTTPGAATVTVTPTTFRAAAGACTALTFKSEDVYHNAVDGQMSFTSTPPGFSYWAGPTCTGSPPGSTAGSNGTTYVKTTVAGSANITGQVAGVQASPAVTVNTDAADASVLTFTPASGGTLLLATCSPNVVAQLQDAFGNPVAPASFPLSLSLSGDVGASFYTENTCTSSLITPTLTGTSSLSFWFKASVAPATPTLTAAGTGVTSATQSWTITEPPPTILGFKLGSAPASPVDRFLCSGPVVVQTQDATNVPRSATALTTVGLDAGPAVSFYSDATCATPVSTMTINAGAHDTSGFYFVAAGAGSTTLAAFSPPLTPASANVDSTGLPAASIGVSGGPDVEAGGCVPLTVSRSLNAGGAISKGISNIALVVDAGITLYSTSDCRTTLASNAVIPAGASSATVYARGRSSAAVSNLFVTATDVNGALNLGSLGLNSYPLVRRGTCTIADTATSGSCSVSAVATIPAGDISRTFLMYQATTAGSTAKDTTVECHLTTAAQVVSVTCNRVGTAGAVDIRWQTASWGVNSGVSVEHQVYSPTAGLDAGTFTLTNTIDPSKSFLLINGASSGAAAFSSRDQFTGYISSPTTVTVAATSLPTMTSSFEVVQMTSARVSRGTGVASGAGAKTFSGSWNLTSPNTARLSPLFTAQVDQGTAVTTACRLRFRGAMSGSTFTATSTNGQSAAGCDASSVSYAWEIIEWPAATTVSSGSVSASGTSATWTVTAMPLDKTLLYFAEQGLGGQSAGETNSTSTTAVESGTALIDYPGATTVTVTRGSSAGTGQFTPFSVTFSP